MKFSALEMAIASAAVQTTGQLDFQGNHVGRLFPISEMADAASAFKKLKEHVTKNAEGVEILNDGELDLTTSEKVLLLKSVSERQWSAPDAEYVLSLIEKLK